MNRNQAYTLIRQTFTQAYDKNLFSNFSQNLLNHIDESKAASWNNQDVKNAFKEHIQRYERLGTYTSPENEKLDILIVHLTNESKLERARTAIRNFVADHLKTRDEKDAALVAFVSPSEATWRFSYVKMEYAAVEKDSGEVGVETHLTPARRFSYIVGEGESCHTAQTRFLDLLQDTETDPLLVDIEDAFSVEAVTKEFFKKYVELFEEIHKALDKLVDKDKIIGGEFTTKNINTVDFAKKLMGQIVFLYFLQKKGWLGISKGQDWGNGPRDFLRRLAREEYCKYDNFFNDVLEPLFYDTLATDRGHEAWCDHFKCRIPFLNGGLFEPLCDYDWSKTDIVLPNRLFTNSEFIEEGIVGTGVLDVFDRYNFTVNEAEPLEKEVAIDPEMLGKVFENLIEENRRKGLGAFYTPREIVHYMCQESLINYLDTAIKKEKGEVRRIDIETFIHLGEQISYYESVDTNSPIKMPESIQKHARLIDEKLSEITVCDPAVGSGAFPVGMMTEIVRGRCALTPYFNDVHERTPYYFKWLAIQNCLYGVDIDAGAVEIAKLRLWLSLVVDEEDVNHIKPLPNLDYKIVVGNSLLGVERNLFNQELFVQLEDLKPLYFDETDVARKAPLKHRIDDLIRQLTNGKEIFDFEIYFSEVFHNHGGFDIVIANPPYVSINELARKRNELIEFLKSGRASLSNFYGVNLHSIPNVRKTYPPKPNLYAFFFVVAAHYLRENGIVTFIAPKGILTAKDLDTLRHFLIKENAIQSILTFRDKVFVHNETSAGTIATSSLVIIFQKQKFLSNYEIVIGDTLVDRIDKFDSRKINSSFFNENLDNWNFITLAPPKARLIENYKKHSGMEIYFTHSDQRRTSQHRFYFDVGFILSKEFIASTVKNENNYYKLVEYSGMKSHVLITEKYYPKEKSKIKLTKNSQGYVVLDQKYKIVWSVKNPILFSFSSEDVVFHMGTAAIIASNDREEILYLLAILNSKLSRFILESSLKSEGEKDFLVPISAIKNYLRVPIFDNYTLPRKAEVVSQCTELVALSGSNVDTSMLEQKIDRLVYKLYNLTAEEIALVEETTSA